MSQLAVLLEPTQHFKRYALVEYGVHKSKAGSLHAVCEIGNPEKSDVVKAEQYVPVPPMHDFHRQLYRLAGNYCIMFHSESQLFSVAGFRFGRPCRIAVPVFANGKVESQRMVTTTRHVKLQDDTWEKVSVKLFRACVSGMLYGYYSGNRLERLHWDPEFKQFTIEVVSKDSIKIK